MLAGKGGCQILDGQPAEYREVKSVEKARIWQRPPTLFAKERRSIFETPPVDT